MLPTALNVLLRVHRAVLAAVAAPPRTLPSGETVFANWDVRRVLGEERASVLRGAVLVFSHIFPLGSRPAEHPLWRMAEEFGARCTAAMEPGVTHVVAGAEGTEKVWAAKQGWVGAAGQGGEHAGVGWRSGGLPAGCGEWGWDGRLSYARLLPQRQQDAAAAFRPPPRPAGHPSAAAGAVCGHSAVGGGQLHPVEAG